ncbi:hypothetical protein [Nocardia carnea]|uniref:hypothetical protein n=1 Tax=Nocardia carnea TaxID=37328 RepID=UPI00245438DA|nr:hypothetical protein [Nocardia carnea]
MTEEQMMRIEFLAARASRLGYQLVQTGTFPERWTLLDAVDSEPIREGLLLTDVEGWLNE